MSATMHEAARLEASALYESEDTYNHPEEVMAKAFERGAAWQAAQSQPAPPVPSSVQEIMRLIYPYMRACIESTDADGVSSNHPRVISTFASLQAALTALVEERDRLKFELDGVRAMRRPEWQPIETAPKDEFILVGPTKRMDISVAMNHSRDGWVTESISDWHNIYTPTHWMPLPAPPSTGIAPEQGENHE